MAGSPPSSNRSTSRGKPPGTPSLPPSSGNSNPKEPNRPAKKVEALALQAKQALRAHARIADLPAPAKAEALPLLRGLEDIANLIADGELNNSDARTRLTLLANDADALHAHANAWCAAASKQSFAEWVRRTLDSRKTGPLHRWANAPNKPFLNPTDCDPDAVANKYAVKWSKCWNTAQPNPTHTHPQANPLNDEEIRHTLNQLRQLATSDTSPVLTEILNAINNPNIRQCLTQFNPNTSTGTDGLAVTDLTDAPDEAVDEFAEILRDAVANLAPPPLQTLFTVLAAIPKKDPLDKRAIGVLTTPLRILGRILYPILHRYDLAATDEGDTAIKGGNLDRATFERHAIAEAITRTKASAVGILWDLQTFFDSVKTYVAIQRTLHRKWDPSVILLTMWSHRAPRIVCVNGAVSRIIPHVPHSLIAGCTSSTSIARAVLPSLDEIDAIPLPTHLDIGTAFYRHVDDIFQLSWADSEKQATIEAIRAASPLIATLLGLQLTISNKTSVVAHSAPLAAHVSNTLRRLGAPAKTKKSWLDCGVMFAGGGKANKSNQDQRIAQAHLRAHRISTACKFDKRAVILATTGVQPMQAYGSSAVGTTYLTAARMRSNLVSAVYGRKAQPCPTSLIHAQLRPQNDPVIRIATKAINDWAFLWRNAKPSTRALLRTAWTQCLHEHQGHTNNLPLVGPITGTIAWITFVGWKPALPNTWTDHSDPNDLRAAILGTSLSEDSIILKDFSNATTNRVWSIAADHFGGKGLEEGPPDFKPAQDAQRKLRTLDLWAQASALEGVTHGTAWPNSRLHPTDVPSQGCPRCDDPHETPWHRYWSCPRNADIPGDHGFIASSDFLRKVTTDNPILYPPCMWARAILPYHLTGAHIPHNEVSKNQGATPVHLTQRYTHLLAYSDGAGPKAHAHLAARKVGSRAFLAAQAADGWSPDTASFCTHVPREQTVPRAELHAATQALLALLSAKFLLIITDAEGFYLTATTSARLAKALGGVNADFWAIWYDTISKFGGGLTIAHIRSHALGSDSKEALQRLTQNIREKKYRTPADRPPGTTANDEAALLHYSESHHGYWHSLGNTFADKAAELAQDAATPTSNLVAHYERYHTFAFLIARRNACIEAHCRDTSSRMQADLTPTPPCPPAADIHSDATRDIAAQGHCLFTDSNGWIRCQRCHRKTRKDPLGTFLSTPCRVESPYLSANSDPTAPDVVPCSPLGLLAPPPAASEPLAPSSGTPASPPDWVGPESMQHTELGRLMLKFATRTTPPPPPHRAPSAASHSQASEPPLASDTPPDHRTPNDWDDPEASPMPTDSTPPEEGPPHPPSAAARRMPLLQRARLILYNRHQRKLRLAYIRATRRSAAKRSANFQPFSLAPAHDSTNIGEGHSAFTLGPITFCRRCGATKSLSQGLSIKRPCRRWAPLGSRNKVKALLAGRPPPFYRRILQGTAIPVKRLRQKTTPAPRFAIPAHLRRHDAPPATPARPHIRLQRITAHRGTSTSMLGPSEPPSPTTTVGTSTAVPHRGVDEASPTITVGTSTAVPHRGVDESQGPGDTDSSRSAGRRCRETTPDEGFSAAGKGRQTKKTEGSGGSDGYG